MPKLLFYGNPGAIITAPLVERAKQSLKGPNAIDIGKGMYYYKKTTHIELGLESPNGIGNYDCTAASGVDDAFLR